MKDRLDSLVMEMIERGIYFNDALGHFEKRFIAKMLERNRGNLRKTAKQLGIHRNTLSKKIEKYKIVT